MDHIMKSRVYFLVILCGVSLFAFSCERKCDIEIEYPSDVMPICWEDYNDAYHVFWNIFKSDCSGAGLTGKTIKISGKLDYVFVHLSHSYVLMSEHEHEHNDIYDHIHKIYNYTTPSVRVFSYFIHEEFQKKITSADLKEKCYIKGELGTSGITIDDTHDQCCFTVPNIFLYSIDDIYFESDKNDEE